MVQGQRLKLRLAFSRLTVYYDAGIFTSFPSCCENGQALFGHPGNQCLRGARRLFSKSRHLWHEVRGSMKAETIMKAMLTKMWIRPGISRFPPASKLKFYCAQKILFKRFLNVSFPFPFNLGVKR
jgi:hypothetical protein